MSTPIHIEIQSPLTCSVSLLIRRPRTRELCLTAYITISTPILPRKHIFKRERAPNKKTPFLWVWVNPTNTWTSYGHTPSRRWRLGDRKCCPQRRNFICDDITSEPGFAVIESCICLDGLYVLSVCERMRGRHRGKQNDDYSTAPSETLCSPLQSLRTSPQTSDFCPFSPATPRSYRA